MTNEASVEVAALRYQVATSCRILGMLGLMVEHTGHVSARIPGTDEMLVRCRGGNEEGVAFTEVENIRRVDFDGKGPEAGEGYAAPYETPIHGEIYRAKPNVMAVVHAHPYFALLCGVTKVEYRPLYGAYDPSSLRIALRGVPVFPRAITVETKELAAEMLDAMGERDVLLMQGHGITVTGATVESATVLAIQFDRLSRIMWDVATSGRPGYDIPPQDLAEYERRSAATRTDRGGWFALQGGRNWSWNYYVRLLQVNGFGLPADGRSR